MVSPCEKILGYPEHETQAQSSVYVEAVEVEVHDIPRILHRAQPFPTQKQPCRRQVRRFADVS